MLNSLIQFSLNQRLLILTLALVVIVAGSIVTQSLPIDVLPDLTRPRVVVMSEAHGYAPEEVEQLVTFPLETAINGANGVMAVRSSSGIGLSMINVEFDWGTDIYVARQIVQERIATVASQLPDDVQPQLGPISSLLGQIMLLGMYSDDAAMDPLELRTLADWVVRQRIMTIPGVSQVITMGGGRKQYQVLVNADLLRKYEVTLPDVERALRASNLNVTGGYVNRNAQEVLVRGIGRIERPDDLRRVVVKPVAGQRPVVLEQVAEVREAAQTKRGDSSVNGVPAVVLMVQKQPGADTRRLTEEIRTAVDELHRTLPSGVQVRVTYEQREFIDHSVANVLEALRDGAILVVIVLFLFLFNLRTTFITLTAIPLSVLVTALCFRGFGMSINVMTLGGIAVALGELVDDAIVDVENIYRRLKLNRVSADPLPALRVIFEASSEVRGAIIISTILVIVVFAPLFALTGMEGRLFRPLAVAYIVSIIASTVVSLTVTPVLSYYLLGEFGTRERGSDGILLRLLKRLATPLIRFSMRPTGVMATATILLFSVIGSGWLVTRIGQDFLPPFDEGAVQVNLFAAPGTSLDTSRRLSQIADHQFLPLLQTPENPEGPIRYFTCRTGRAEQDEHVMGVNVSEYVISLNSESGLSRGEVIRQLHEAVRHVASVEAEVEQPIAHLISHMLSGVTAQIAIKIYGDDLDVLRRLGEEVKEAIADVTGLAPPLVEQQQLIPQLRIELDYQALADYGLTAGYVNDLIETALSGKVVSRVLEGQKAFDLMVRFSEEDRADFEQLHRLPLELPDGGKIPLSAVAQLRLGAGPSVINREDGRRRIVVRVNTLGRDLGSAVAEIQAVVRDRVDLPEGCLVLYGGQFEAQQSATRRVAWLSAVALVVTFGVLYSNFPSVSIVLQILMALPAAFVGGVLALWFTGQSFSVASLVGFISLGGIAARNGLLLVSTYLSLIPERGYRAETILQGSLDRLAPVLMTALTTGIGLIPIMVGGHLPGKELLLPIATVMLGGLATSSLCEFIVRPGLFFALSRRAAARLSSPDDLREVLRRSVLSACGARDGSRPTTESRSRPSLHWPAPAPDCESDRSFPCSHSTNRTLRPGPCRRRTGNRASLTNRPNGPLPARRSK